MWSWLQAVSGQAFHWTSGAVLLQGLGGETSSGCELTHITTWKDLTVAIWSHGPPSAPERAYPSCSKECCFMSCLGNTVS